MPCMVETPISEVLCGFKLSHTRSLLIARTVASIYQQINAQSSPRGYVWLQSILHDFGRALGEPFLKIIEVNLVLGEVEANFLVFLAHEHEPLIVPNDVGVMMMPNKIAGLPLDLSRDLAPVFPENILRGN